ncbi:MAG TPA: GAF domain-containing protein, partial [Candidatus Eisenbacteria bacterium]
MKPSGAPRSPAPPVRALASLGSLSFAVQAALDPDALFQALSEHVLNLAGADRFILLLLDDETGELEGHSFERDLAGSRRVRLAPDPNGFLGQVLRRETLVVDDPARTSPVGRDELGWSGAAPATIVGLPVLIGTTLLGVA